MHLYFLIGLGLAMALAAVGSVTYREILAPGKRALRRFHFAPRIHVRDARDGELVKLIGRVHLHGAPLTSPIAHRPCVAYWTEIQSLRGRNGWMPYVTECGASDFWLEDTTGRALVLAGDAVIWLRDDAAMMDAPFEGDLPPALRALLDRHGKSGKSLLGVQLTLRVIEGVLTDGEQGAAYGLPRMEGAAERVATEGQGYRGAQQRLVLAQTPEVPLVIGDASAAR